MGQNVLIAERRDILRIGLRTIFFEDSRVANICEATNYESLQTQLLYGQLDLVVVNQALITDITALPRDDFVILTSELDITMLQAAFKHGARGYLSENASAELLRIMLQPIKGSFLIEPGFTPGLMRCMFGDKHCSAKDELLTPREREIVSFLREGFNRQTIAKRLCISESTLKTHIKNIARKC